MRTSCGLVLVLAAALVAIPATAQRGRGPRPPAVRGVFNPTIGSGAVYKTANGEMEVSLVGKEDVNGKTGYWIQIGMGGQSNMKQLWVLDGKNMTIARTIVQAQGEGPMEMPPGMFGLSSMSSDARGDGQLVGTESVTTPAGTFSCEHYRATNGKWDVWLAPNIPPWGLVKSKDETGEMVVQRVMTGVPDRITGTPQKLELPPGFSMPGR